MFLPPGSELPRSQDTNSPQQCATTKRDFQSLQNEGEGLARRMVGVGAGDLKELAKLAEGHLGESGGSRWGVRAAASRSRSLSCGPKKRFTGQAGSGIRLCAFESLFYHCPVV